MIFVGSLTKFWKSLGKKIKGLHIQQKELENKEK